EKARRPGAGRRARDALGILAKSLNELLEGHHLPAPCRGRHRDERSDAGREPRLDALANLGGAAEERDVPELAIGHELGDALGLPAREGLADRDHLFLVARLDPIVLVV